MKFNHKLNSELAQILEALERIKLTSYEGWSFEQDQDLDNAIASINYLKDSMRTKPKTPTYDEQMVDLILDIE